MLLSWVKRSGHGIHDKRVNRNQQSTTSNSETVNNCNITIILTEPVSSISKVKQTIVRNYPNMDGD